MKSARPKVLHEIASRSMLAHVMASARGAGAARLAVVVGPSRPDVAEEVGRVLPGTPVYEQTERLGTAHAVLAARAAIAQGCDDLVVLYGDTPLVRSETIDRLRAPLAEGAAVAVLGFEAADPTGYGRLLTREGALVAIREEKEASEAERTVTLCNAGLIALRGDLALSLLERVGNANAKGEFYLTDVVEIARDGGGEARVVTADEAEVQGVNDRLQLSQAEAALQERLRRQAMLSGVTLVSPDTVTLSADTELAADVVIEPHVVFGPGVVVETGARIRAFSHLEGARVGPGGVIGPYARLRPGATLAADVHVGNFVEVKNADLGRGVKANHLAYIGDASVGARTNIGAGTITCNYDGAKKHRTTIGEDAFIGSDTSLVAPVTIGDGAYTGTGSVITEDVPAGALALGRARQVVKEGWSATKKPRKS